MRACRHLVGGLAGLPLLGACLAVWAQIDTGETWSPTFGNRPIDKLPKSGYAESEEYRDWDEPGPPVDYEVLLHTKQLFRVGQRGIERLCVIEARRPEDEPGPVSLVLTADDGSVRWRSEAAWLGTNQRMRPYWLPVALRERQELRLQRDARVRARVAAPLGDGAPAVLLELAASDEVLAVDAGLALLPASELVVRPGAPLRLRVGVAEGFAGPILVQVQREHPAGLDRESRFDLEATGDGDTVEFEIPTGDLSDSQALLGIKATADGAVLAEHSGRLHLSAGALPMRFGAEYTRLRHTAPVVDGDEERSWEEIWRGSSKRDVVVSFPGQPYRMVFWRGANYVACWALPEAWLTYEWLEAEPDFYGAVGCVEPLQDKDCRYSRVGIISSTPARAVVSWKYALTDLEVKIIREERAEEIFTLYPDGVGTRHMRGFYGSGWHENQEFIVVNRPGRWPSTALDPQAITFLSPDGERQAPVWPKPGFSLDGWPQVISIINLGTGPRPFMVTPDAPTQVKVWADPYVDKPDLFNSYPHWPVTRGMRTSWLEDPADFERPTHSNLANLVNSPVETSPGEKDFLWLIGMGSSEREVREVSRCWLNPGRIVAGRNVTAKGYSQIERAYMLIVDDPGRPCEFNLVPEPDTPIINPAFIIEGWRGAATVSITGAEEVEVGQEAGGEAGTRLVVWARGRFAEPAEVRAEAGE